ncbi:MAG TPA: orotidine-5'-phosphate decarboxylase [Gemmatimonadales bacterium]|nr:orotidine-5'-phosphate decarboxylase [Gemmatimonadales bacterium]
MAEIIVALDLPSRDESLRWLDRAAGLRWAKIGSVLFTREGPGFVREVVERGLKVFLDLKWHDIPNTVAGAVEGGRAIGATMATIHTLGGMEMMRAAAAASGPDLGVVGVTVLTSHTGATYGEATGRGVVDPEEEVRRQARNAATAGLKGIVCSPHEITAVRGVLPAGAWIVVPGIRRPGDAAGDQARVAGPAEAAKAGATHLVVGRPLLQAQDPAAAVREFQEAAR